MKNETKKRGGKGKREKQKKKKKRIRAVIVPDLVNFGVSNVATFPKE